MILMEKKFLIKMILFKIKSINISTIKVLILLKIKKKNTKKICKILKFNRMIFNRMKNKEHSKHKIQVKIQIKNLKKEHT